MWNDPQDPAKLPLAWAFVGSMAHECSFLQAPKRQVPLLTVVSVVPREATGQNHEIAAISRGACEQVPCAA